MKGPLIQLYPFLVLWIFLNVFTLNIISSPFPRNDILCCDWSLFTLLTVRCRMLYLPFLMCIFMGMWCVCACLNMHAAVWSYYPMSFLTILYLICWGRVSLRSWSPPVLTTLESQLVLGMPSLSASTELDHRRLLFLPGISLDSGDPSSGVLTLAQEVLPPLSHLPGPKLDLFKNFYFLSID